MLSPRTRTARRPSRTRLGTPQTPFPREDPDPWRDADDMTHGGVTGEGAKGPHQTAAGVSYAFAPASILDVQAGQRTQGKRAG